MPKYKKTFLLFLPILFAACLTAGCRSKLTASPVPPDAERILCCREMGESAVFYDPEGFWAEEQSAILVQKKKEEIVFSIRCFFSTHSARRAEGNDQDPLALFQGEHTEILLYPDSDLKHAYHFAVDPEGKSYMAIDREIRKTMEDVRITTKKGKNFWDSEYHIPYAALGVKAPRKGEIWRVNFCRLNAPKTGKAKWSSWNHSASFHDFSTMGALCFSPKEELPPPPPLRYIRRGKESVTLELAELSSTPRIEIKEGKILWERKVDSPGVLTFFRRVLPPFHALKSDALLTLHNKEKNSEQLRCLCAPMAGDPLLPDRFYYTGEAILCRTLAPTGTLRLLDTTGDLLQSVPVVSGMGKLDSAPLEPGCYIVEFQTEKERTTRTIIRRKAWQALELPAEPLQTSGETFRRGTTPFYLIGISDEAAGENFYPFPPEFTCGRSCGLARNAVPVVSLDETGKQPGTYDESFFRNLSLAPGTICRIDCRTGSTLLPEREKKSVFPLPGQRLWYENVAKAARKANPALLLSLHLDSQERLTEYARIADVLEYSDRTASFAADDMMRHLPGTITRIKQIVPGKPLLFHLGGSLPDGKCRTPEELRAGIYLSLLAGFRGNIIDTGNGGIPAERTRMWSFLCGISREINEFYPRWVTGEEIPFPLPATFSGSARRWADGSTMLVVVNLRDGENHLTLPQLERRFTPYEAAVLFWKEKIQLPDDQKRNDE